MQSISDLEKQAIELFPMPLGACVWVRMRVEFKRERWVKTQTQTQIK